MARKTVAKKTAKKTAPPHPKFGAGRPPIQFTEQDFGRYSDLTQGIESLAAITDQGFEIPDYALEYVANAVKREALDFFQELESRFKAAEEGGAR
jgi:hypothetical protein